MALRHIDDKLYGKRLSHLTNSIYGRFIFGLSVCLSPSSLPFSSLHITNFLAMHLSISVPSCSLSFDPFSYAFPLFFSVLLSSPSVSFSSSFLSPLYSCSCSSVFILVSPLSSLLTFSSLSIFFIHIFPSFSFFVYISSVFPFVPLLLSPVSSLSVLCSLSPFYTYFLPLLISLPLLYLLFFHLIIIFLAIYLFSFFSSPFYSFPLLSLPQIFLHFLLLLLLLILLLLYASESHKLNYRYELTWACKDLLTSRLFVTFALSH